MNSSARLRWALGVLLLAGVTLAQNVPLPPVNPLNYFLRVLDNEARLNVRGVVSERQVFPPRKEPEATRGDIPAPPPIFPMLLRQGWTVTVNAGEQIAGRETWRLEFKPRNERAARFTYWMDREWNIRLGVQETDAQGDVTYNARYTSLEKPAKRASPRNLTRLEPRPKLEAFVKQQIGGYYLPDGFKLFEVRPRTVRDNQNALELRISNGLSVLVIVFSPVSTGKSPKVAVRDLKGSWVWVIGNLPQDELERVATSLRAPLQIGSLLNGFSGVPR
jgi:hypothetical protein